MRLCLPISASSVALFGTSILNRRAVTNLRANITVQNKESKELCIINLSVPFEPYLDNAHTHKSDKYAPLINDITDNICNVFFYAFEIDSRDFMLGMLGINQILSLYIYSLYIP